MDENDLSFWSNISNTPTEDWMNGNTGTNDGMFNLNYDLGSGITNAGGPNVYSPVSSQDGWTNNPVDTSTGNNFNLGNLFGGLSGTQLGQIGTGLLGAYTTNQQGQAQQQLAQQLLSNADPYKQYRQQAEIPFMLAQMQQYGGLQDKQNQLIDTMMGSKAVTGDPAVDAYKAKALGYNPLGGDYGFYQKQLQQSYTDPMKVYNDQGYQTLANLFGSQIARRDAANGRLSQYGDRATEMQGNFLKYLNDYRSGLNSAAGTSGNMQENYLNSMLGGSANLQNANTGQLGALSGLFGQVNSGLNNLAGIITPRGTAGAGAGQAASLASNGSALNNAALSSLINPGTIGLLQNSFGG